MTTKHSFNDVWCDECDQPVQLRRNGNVLFAGCGCENTSIRVSQVIPDGWDA